MNTLKASMLALTYLALFENHSSLPPLPPKGLTQRGCNIPKERKKEKKTPILLKRRPWMMTYWVSSSSPPSIRK